VELTALQRESHAMKSVAEDQLAHSLSRGKVLTASVDKLEQQLALVQQEVDDEAQARFRAEDALTGMRAAMLAQQPEGEGEGAMIRALQTERRQLQIDFDDAVAATRETFMVRLELEETIGRLKEEVQGKSAHLASRVQRLDAQVALQRVQEEESILREQELLARLDSSERRGDGREMEEKIREVREEEEEKRVQLEDQVDELQRQLLSLDDNNRLDSARQQVTRLYV